MASAVSAFMQTFGIDEPAGCYDDIELTDARVESIGGGANRVVPTGLHVTADLNLGESQEVTLAGGKKIIVKVLDLMEQRDSLRGAVRKAEVKVLVD